MPLSSPSSIAVVVSISIFLSVTANNRRHDQSSEAARIQSNVTNGFRRRHQKLQLGHNQIINHANFSHSNCAVSLPKGCSCFKKDGTLNLNCSSSRMTEIPRSLTELGPNVVRTLNLENNSLASINDGDFFGLKIERLLIGNNKLVKLEFLAFWGLEFNLKTLDLSYNRLTDLPSEALRLLRNLRSLSLTGNRITILRDFDFGYLRNLGVLALDKNPITNISANAFTGTQLLLLSLAQVRLEEGLSDVPTTDLKHLEALSLERNKIRTIPERWFENMKSLKYLSLNDNLFEDIPSENSFGGLENTLVTLELSGNRLQTIPNSAISVLGRLESLDLSRNRLSKLGKRAFNCSSHLQTLNLSGNRLTKIYWKAFHGLTGVKNIDLTNNRLTMLDERTFSDKQNSSEEMVLPSGITVHLGGNPWLCNCLIKWMKKEIKRILNEKLEPRLFGDVNSIICDRPQILEFIPLANIPMREFTCDHDYYYYYDETVEYGDERNDDSDDTKSSGAGEDTAADYE